MSRMSKEDTNTQSDFVIEEMLKDEIEEMKSKRSFLQGLKDYIKGNKKNE